MIAALHKESRIEAGGTSHNKKTGNTRYVLRYQASQMEDYRATQLNQKPGVKPAVTGVHYIVIGKTLYTYAQKRWYKVAQLTPPDAVDVLSLSTGGAFCCTRTGVLRGTRLSYHGTTSLRGVRVYVVKYHTGTVNGGAYGKIDIATGSYLPQQYTVTTVPTGTRGTFTLTYGGSFNIKAPKT
jgi:hypothetical protein